MVYHMVGFLLGLHWDTCWITNGVASWVSVQPPDTYWDISMVYHQVGSTRRAVLGYLYGLPLGLLYTVGYTGIPIGSLTRLLVRSLASPWICMGTH
eukprot:8917538-Ditylum_brightwellii.AAC.1